MKTRISLFVTIYFLSVAVLCGQNRYWVGGSGTWHDAAHWSLASSGPGGASVPDSTNNEFLMPNHFLQMVNT